MNSTRLQIVMLLLPLSLLAQSWQWAKRGGSTDSLGDASFQLSEAAYGMVRDGDQNVYFITRIGKNNADIDGTPITTYADPWNKGDYAIVSFSCSGAFRWARVIGGGGRELLAPLGIDGEGNIYVAGSFGTCNQDGTYPSTVDGYGTLPVQTDACTTLFTAKYDSDGNLLWFKQPQVPTTFQNTTYSFFLGLETDAAGNTYLLAQLPTGSCFNGALTVTNGPAWYVIQCNSSGNFVSASALNMELGPSARGYLKFYRNPYNGQYYITSYRFNNDTVVLNGEPITYDSFIVSFASDGTFLWKREFVTSIGTNSSEFYDLQFDENNNIYAFGRLWNDEDSFLGYTTNFTTTGLGRAPFLMKLNPTADTVLWASSANQNAQPKGAMTFNGDTIALTTSGGSLYGMLTWGSVSIQPSSQANPGNRPILALFDKATGACQSMYYIPGPANSINSGTSIVPTGPGSYIIGGFLTENLTIGSTTLTSVGGDSDFFVAKFGTEACSLGLDDSGVDALSVYPNPTNHLLHVEGQAGQKFRIFNLNGQEVVAGIIPETGIEVSTLAKGIYLLHLEGKRSVKFVKE